MKKGISRFSMAFAGAALAAQVATVSVAAEPHWDRNGRIERNGQTAEQQSADRYECHGWARGSNRL